MERKLITKTLAIKIRLVTGSGGQQKGPDPNESTFFKQASWVLEGRICHIL